MPVRKKRAFIDTTWQGTGMWGGPSCSLVSRKFIPGNCPAAITAYVRADIFFSTPLLKTGQDWASAFSRDVTAHHTPAHKAASSESNLCPADGLSHHSHCSSMTGASVFLLQLLSKRTCSSGLLQTNSHSKCNDGFQSASLSSWCKIPWMWVTPAVPWRGKILTQTSASPRAPACVMDLVVYEKQTWSWKGDCQEKWGRPKGRRYRVDISLDTRIKFSKITKNNFQK